MARIAAERSTSNDCDIAVTAKRWASSQGAALRAANRLFGLLQQIGPLSLGRESSQCEPDLARRRFEAFGLGRRTRGVNLGHAERSNHEEGNGTCCILLTKVSGGLENALMGIVNAGDRAARRACGSARRCGVVAGSAGSPQPWESAVSPSGSAGSSTESSTSIAGSGSSWRFLARMGSSGLRQSSKALRMLPSPGASRPKRSSTLRSSS